MDSSGVFAPTTRLDLAQPDLDNFAARVVGMVEDAGKLRVVLDRSAFFPEGGGQPSDRGQLTAQTAAGEVTLGVEDVQVDDSGVVHHTTATASAGLAVGDAVVGRIQWQRRREYMALHTGQHLLSRMLLDHIGGATVSARLGERTCTIDINVERVDDGQLAAAEDAANAVIDADVEVKAWQPSPSELAKLPLRKDPSVATAVRVVAIGSVDVSPCGGTHCTRSGQIGQMRILGAERYKGMIRISFVSGPRARREWHERDRELAAGAVALGVGLNGVAAAIARLQAQVGEAASALGRLRGALADAVAEALLRSSGAGPVLVAPLYGDLELARSVATRLAASGKDVVLGASDPADPANLLLVAHRGASNTFDAGAVIKSVTRAGGGRGGGRPEHAEGKVPREVDWIELVGAALAASGSDPR